MQENTNTFDYVVNDKKLGNNKISFPQKRLDRKINLKLVKSDVQVLDLIAAHYNVPRSVIVNDILHKILMDEFNSIKDADTKYLIALYADANNNHTPCDDTWQETMMKEFGYNLHISLEPRKDTYFYQGEYIPHSETFKQIYRRLKDFDPENLNNIQ